MRWNKFRIKTTTEAEDVICSSLMEIGIQGVEIEDKVPLSAQDKEQMFVDILPEFGEDDGTAYISFYLEEGEEGDGSFRSEGRAGRDCRFYGCGSGGD